MGITRPEGGQGQHPLVLSQQLPWASCSMTPRTQPGPTIAPKSLSDTSQSQLPSSTQSRCALLKATRPRSLTLWLRSPSMPSPDAFWNPGVEKRMSYPKGSRGPGINRTLCCLQGDPTLEFCSPADTNTPTQLPSRTKLSPPQLLPRVAKNQSSVVGSSLGCNQPLLSAMSLVMVCGG